MMGFWMAIVAMAAATLTGWSLLIFIERFLVARSTTRHWVEVLGISILLGMAFTTAGAFAWSYFGGRLNARFSWVQVIMALVVGVVRYRVRSRALPLAAKPVVISPQGPGALARVCQVAIGIMIALAFAQTLLTPQRFWDERAIFAIKGRVLYEAETINAPELRHPDFVQYHPQYPVLIPLLERHIYALSGEVCDRWAKVWFPLMYAGLVLSFAGVLSRRFSPDEGWLMSTLLATVPILMPDEYGFLCAQADAPMACFHGLAVLCLWDGIQEPPGAARRRGQFLAASFAATALFVKDEGKAYLLVDLIAWGLTLLLKRGRLGTDQAGEGRLRSASRHLAGMIGFALVACTLVIPWSLHRLSLPTTTEMHYFERLSVSRLIEQWATLKWSIPHLLHRMFGEWSTWGLPWWLVLIAMVTAPRRCLAGPQLFLLLNLLGALAAFVVAGMLAPAELEEHLGGSSHRYLMQLVPVAILFVAGAWGRPGAGHTSSLNIE